jgi:CheY-like chemotaxis protein
MRKKRILIVDDEVSLTRLMQLALEQAGRYEVRAENDSAAVLAAAKEFRPDLIILDLIMPQLDGGDVAEALRMDPELAAIPIVFLSASVRRSEIDANDGVLGGFPFLSKPVSATEITAFIEKHLKD